MTFSEGQRPRIGYCRAAARRILKEFSVKTPGTPVDEIVQAAGLTVFERDWAQRTSGILFRNRMVIGVNGNHAATRRRFTLAHEYGHYALSHHLWYESGPEVTIDNPPAEGCAGENRTVEQEADAFAGEFLIPLQILKETIRKEKRPKALARRSGSARLQCSSP